MKNTSTHFQFSKEQKDAIKEILKGYLSDELELDIGDLQADLFVDFLNEHVGKEYYNLGVTDTVAAIKEKTTDLVMLIKE